MDGDRGLTMKRRTIARVEPGCIIRFCASVALTIGLALGLHLTDVAAGDHEAQGVQVQNSVVRFAQETDIPALETGRVADVNVRLNDPVASGSAVARLDDRSLLIRRRVAVSQLQQARRDAEDETGIDFANLSLRAAEDELATSRSIQKDARGAVPFRQVKLLQLAVDRARVEVSEAKKRRDQASVQADMREAELAMIDEQLRNLHAASPIRGVVLVVHKSVGEWVEKGETIATVGQIDRLHIHALLDSSRLSAEACAGCPVSVHWTDRTSGRPQSLRGKVLSVDPQMLPGGHFRLHAEIVNRQADSTNSQADSRWILRPGEEVSMRVYPSTATAANRSSRF